MHISVTPGKVECIVTRKTLIKATIYMNTNNKIILLLSLCNGQ